MRESIDMDSSNSLEQDNTLAPPASEGVSEKHDSRGEDFTDRLRPPRSLSRNHTTSSSDQNDDYVVLDEQRMSPHPMIPIAALLQDQTVDCKPLTRPLPPLMTGRFITVW